MPPAHAKTGGASSPAPSMVESEVMAVKLEPLRASSGAVVLR